MRLGCPCPPPEDLPDPGIEPASLTSALAGMFFTTCTTWEAWEIFLDKAQMKLWGGEVVGSLPRWGGGEKKPFHGFCSVCHLEQETGTLCRGETSQPIVATLWNFFQGRKGPGIPRGRLSGRASPFAPLFWCRLKILPGNQLRGREWAHSGSPGEYKSPEFLLRWNQVEMNIKGEFTAEKKWQKRHRVARRESEVPRSHISLWSTRPSSVVSSSGSPPWFPRMPSWDALVLLCAVSSHSASGLCSWVNCRSKADIPSADPAAGAQWAFAGRSAMMHAREPSVLLEEPFKMASLSLSQGPRDKWFGDAWHVILISLSFAEEWSRLRSLWWRHGPDRCQMWEASGCWLCSALILWWQWLLLFCHSTGPRRV